MLILDVRRRQRLLVVIGIGTLLLSWTVVSRARPVESRFDPLRRSLIAFNGQNDLGHWAIYTLAADHGRIQRVTNSQGSALAWSPDGRKLVFDDVVAPPPACDDGCTDLFIVSAEGTGRRRLTYGASSRGPAHTPVWSPDGRWIAFFRPNLLGGDGAGIYVVSANGRSRVRRVTRLTGVPAWSPDGRWIAFAVDSGRIYRVRPDGSDLRLITRYGSGNVEWSPSGKRLSFTRLVDVRSRRQSAPAPRERGEVDVVDADGRNLHRVTNKDEDAGAASWSPDGTLIAFVSRKRGLAGRCGSAAIEVTRADGRRRRRVTPYGPAYVSLSWSPDGKSIAFVNEPRCGYAATAVSVAAADGGGTRVLTPKGPPWPGGALAWQPLRHRGKAR
jgi:Tol biopolymer transport system component